MISSKSIIVYIPLFVLSIAISKESVLYLGFPKNDSTYINIEKINSLIKNSIDQSYDVIDVNDFNQMKSYINSYLRESRKLRSEGKKKEYISYDINFTDYYDVSNFKNEIFFEKYILNALLYGDIDYMLVGTENYKDAEIQMSMIDVRTGFIVMRSSYSGKMSYEGTRYLVDRLKTLYPAVEVCASRYRQMYDVKISREEESRRSTKNNIFGSRSFEVNLLSIGSFGTDSNESFTKSAAPSDISTDVLLSSSQLMFRYKYFKYTLKKDLYRELIDTAHSEYENTRVSYWSIPTLHFPIFISSKTFYSSLEVSLIHLVTLEGLLEDPYSQFDSDENYTNNYSTVSYIDRQQQSLFGCNVNYRISFRKKDKNFIFIDPFVEIGVTWRETMDGYGEYPDTLYQGITGSEFEDFYWHAANGSYLMIGFSVFNFSM